MSNSSQTSPTSINAEHMHIKKKGGGYSTKGGTIKLIVISYKLWSDVPDVHSRNIFSDRDAHNFADSPKQYLF